MINFSKSSFPNSSFPLIKIDNFISKKSCVNLKKAIEKQKEFDDLVMNGRNRINKGSNNFRNFLSSSKDAKKLYNSLNSRSTLNKLLKIFKNNFKKDDWKFEIKNLKYSKINFGNQKGKILTKQKLKDKKKNVVNLDIDFSMSKRGYFREPHRDRSTRIINFLIYLNSIPRKNGGILEIFKTKKDWGSEFSSNPRFPKKKFVKLINKFQPKNSQGLFFISSPNSYHGVSKFMPKNNSKRVFIYGSFSLNKPVRWLFNSKKDNG